MSRSNALFSLTALMGGGQDNLKKICLENVAKFLSHYSIALKINAIMLNR